MPKHRGRGRIAKWIRPAPAPKRPPRVVDVVFNEHFFSLFDEVVERRVQSYRRIPNWEAPLWAVNSKEVIK